jgi:GT2 family glycosyltransferase/glycosyltransferase involved in cell wall biosynthesis
MSNVPRVDIVNINFYDWTGTRLYAGGAERYVLDLAQLLQRSGLKARILQNANARFARSLGGIDVVGVPAAAAIEFDTLSAGMDGEIRGASLVVASPVELACRLAEGVPVIGINHGIWWDDPLSPRGPDSAPARAAMLSALQRADATVCVDTNFINWIRTSGLEVSPMLEFIPNYASLDRFVHTNKVFDGRLRVLFPRRLCIERGFHELLRAFDVLFARRTDLELHVCGSGSDASETLMQEFRQRHPDRVTWTKREMDEMPEIYAQCHIVALPTLYGEGTSMSCIEAMATSNAIVATQVGGLPNLIIDEYNGLLIAPGAPALAAAIDRLADNRDLLKNLARNARDVSAAFGREKWELSWLDAIDRVLSGKGGAARGGSELAEPPETSLKSIRLAIHAARTRRDAVQAENASRLRHAEELAAALSTMKADLGIATESLARMASENAALSARVALAETEIATLTSREVERLRELADRERKLAARDEAIAWLGDELRNARDEFEARSRSIRLLGADLARALLQRTPRLKRALKALVPARLWQKSRNATYAHQLAVTAPSVPPRAANAPSTLASGTAPPAAPGTASLSNANNATADCDALGTYDIICFGIIEWTARYQRPQQLMDRFARAGNRVFYVEASRKPPPGKQYVADRVGDRVYRICLRVDQIQDFYRYSMTPANEASMAEAISALARDFRIKSAVACVELPYWRGLGERLRRDRGWKLWYDCMDEWADFPNIGAELLVEEERLVRSADLVTMTASLLHVKWSPTARRSLLVRNGADFEFFRERCVPNSLLEGIGHPVIGFYGGLAEWIDYALIAECARRRPSWSFVLVGDVFVTDLAGLDKLPNVHMLGRRPYDDMPRYLYHFDVCMIPFKLNDVTHAVDPVKFYEYMSAGKPVVAVPLKEMAIYEEVAHFATGATEFEKAIVRALSECDPVLWNQRIALARDNDWLVRQRDIAAAIETLYPMVTVIVVTFGNFELTRLCLDSIFANTTWPRYEIVVVDNASTDETRTYLRYLARARSNVKIILNEENRGFAAANNQGLDIAAGQYLVLLNNDTVVPRGWLEPMIARLDDPRVGMVGPVTNFVGNEAKIEVDYATLDQMGDFAESYTRQHAGEEFDIKVLAMYCVAFTRSVYEKIGGLDEAFGVGMFEDDDYCRRMQALGLRTICLQYSFVHHFGQATFKKLIATGEYDRLWAANRDLYEKKWGAWTPHRHRVR